MRFAILIICLVSWEICLLFCFSNFGHPSLSKRQNIESDLPGTGNKKLGLSLTSRGLVQDLLCSAHYFALLVQPHVGD